jgi:hypothetical protein
MKFRRLTKEQFEDMHEEFSTFLATQGIDRTAWQTKKDQESDEVDQLLDQFSDLVWDAVLERAAYIENISANHMYLFKCLDQEIKLVAIEVANSAIDLREKDGFDWFKKHYNSDYVTYKRASKAYAGNKNSDKFEIIEKGGVITKGSLYYWFEDLLDSAEE